jgi:polar amino acid transport system permease protein
LSLSLNTAAFNAEIWRSAIQNFSKDQREAAQACGMTEWTFFRSIMLPQIVAVSLPALVNEMSFLIKGSPAVAIIGLVDLTRVTNRIASVTYEPLYPIMGAGIIYIIIISVLVKIQSVAEVKARRLAI